MINKQFYFHLTEKCQYKYNRIDWKLRRLSKTFRLSFSTVIRKKQKQKCCCTVTSGIEAAWLLFNNMILELVCDSCVKRGEPHLHPPWCQRLDENSQEFRGSFVGKTGKTSLTLICRIEHDSSSNGAPHWYGSLTCLKFSVILGGTTEIHFCKCRFSW